MGLLRAALVIGLATSMAKGRRSSIGPCMTGGSHSITRTVIGDSDSPDEANDKSLMMLQVAMSGLDQIKHVAVRRASWRHA